MNLILVREIQKITDFVEREELTSHIVVELKLVNCKELENIGKEIDKENYSKDCFGIDFYYIHSTKKIYALDNGLYYLDNNGRKNHIGSSRLELGNIIRSIHFEYGKFLKDKNKYLKENNTDYDLI